MELVDGIIKKAVYPEDEMDKQKFEPFWSHLSSSFGTAQSGKDLLNLIMNKPVGFDTVKPVELIESLINHVVEFDKNSIILDSFAGSGTTAHAVLNLNKADGGNRTFILVEMEDYAESITAERVKRVISGYGNGKNAVGCTGGSFTYYELGGRLFTDSKMLNENISTDKIREYIWYNETHSALGIGRPPKALSGWGVAQNRRFGA